MKIVMSQESAGRWTAWVPELPGCAVRGDSQQEITRKIDVAIRGYLASWDVPVPAEVNQELVHAEPRANERVAVPV